MRSCYTFLLMLLLSVALSAQTTLLDFEGGAPTFNDFNGSASAVIANPDANEPNVSANVVQNVIPGGSAFAGVNIPLPVDLGVGKTFTMQVWSPIENAPVLLKIENSQDDAVERLATATGAANSWQTLEFDFSDEADLSFAGVTIFMNFNVVDGEERVFYWDNLTQSDEGGGGGGGTTELATLDFETGAPTFNDFNGSATSVILNPDQQEPNTSDSVAQNFVPADAAFAGVNIPFQVDLGEGKVFTMQVWSPIENAPVLLKIENSQDDAVERLVTASGPANSWQTLEFDFGSEADRVLAGFTVFMNFNVVSGEDLTFYWDNLIQTADGGGGGNGDGAQLALPVTFDDPEVDYGLAGFGGSEGAVVVDPTDATNMVGQVTKMAGAELWAGVTMTSTSGGPDGFATPIPFTADETVITVRVWSPNVGTNVLLKAEQTDDPAVSVETSAQTTVAGEWETLTFDFANPADGTAPLNVNAVYGKLSIFPDFGNEFPAEAVTYYFDDVIFTGEGGGNGGGGNDETPMVAAPTPTRAAADVISMFSNAYDNVPVDTWRTDWSSGTLEDIQIEGNDTKRYDDLVFVGVETIGSPIDLEAAEMTHFHVDYWTADLDTFRIKIVDFLGDGFDGANGDTEDELSYATTKGEWVSLDIPLDDFAAMTAQSDINQLLFVGTPTGTVFVDNVYYYKRDPDATNTPVTGLLEVYPNPARAQVVITAPARMQDVTLYDFNGRRVRQQAVNADRVTLNLEGLPAGFYVALVNTASGAMTVKVTKE